MPVVRRPKHLRSTTSCPAIAEDEAPCLRVQVTELFREHRAKVWTDDQAVGEREGDEAYE